jgi:cytochrome c2
MLKRIILTATSIFLVLPVWASPLSDAAKSGDAALVEKLLNDGADVNEADTFGTPLHFAALSGHADVVALLSLRGADLGAKSDLLGTPLHAAITRNHWDTAAVLLTQGADVDARDRDDRTPLHIAAKNGSVELVKLLVDAGADVNFSRVGQGDNPYKLGEQTALHVALQNNYREVADLLISAGAAAMPVQSASEALSVADKERGRELAGTYCKTCHAVEIGDPPPAALDHGPPIIGIYGQPVAQDAAFEYSDALKDFGGEWTDDRLYSFVLRPMLTVPGTLMGHQLVKKPDEIADITAFLKSLAE